MFRKIIKEWYVLNKTQRRGTIILFLLFLFTLLFKWLYHPSLDKDTIYFAKLELEKFSDSTYKNIVNASKDSLFFFNPNNISESEMKQLGLSDKIIRNIINYRKGGGRFHTKESLKKIYTMNDSVYQKLEPYILIDNNKQSITIAKENTPHKKTPQKENIISVEINSADSLQLEQLKGIGKILSVRIIKYRNRLGGFYTVEQLKEVYGINDTLYNIIITKNKILADTQLIRKINISTADFKTMIKHPYFNKDIVTIILSLQKNKEKITKEKLKNLLDENIFRKIIHYIEF